MSIGYHFAEQVIIIEFSLIAVIVLTTVTLKSYYYFKNVKNKKMMANIERSLKKMMLTHQKFQSRDFKNKWKKLDILLKIVDRLDVAYTSDLTGGIRTDFITSIIFPLAKKAALSRNWVSRFYAAKAFGLIPGKGNDKLIEKLVNDPVPLVNLYADKAALINHSDAGINAMITRMASETWLAKSIKLREFENIKEKDRKYFENKLTSTQDQAVRAVCYEIMLKYPPDPIKWDMSTDIHSQNTELKLAAMKFIFYVNQDAAIPILIKLLTDPHWEVRLLAIHRLNMSNAKQAIPHIAPCLNDPDWWVKISAAEALKKMGKEGESVLRSKNPALNEISFNLNHQLSTWW